ncbi:MAG: hypothetical protein RR415_13010 [Ruthenibacterium sp.]
MLTQIKEKAKRHVIWGNMNLDLDDWRDDLLNEYPELDDDKLYEKMVDVNAERLDDERLNLDIQLPQSIILIADIGRWNGRFSGYKVIESGNIRDCLYSDTDMSEWYVDELGDLRADCVHHDGHNHYLYRAFRDDVSDAQVEHFKDKIYSGNVTRADITRVTRRIGDVIANVYGFQIRMPSSKQN